MVEEEDSSGHRLPLVTWQHHPFLEQRCNRGEHHLILVFHNSLLLWGVRSKEVALYIFTGAEISELLAGERTIVVSAQNMQWAPD
jgi:hypothetical protein